MRIVLMVLAVAAGVLPGAGRPEAAQPTIDQPLALLQALDKITARVSPLEVAVGDTAQFGTLAITLRACRSTAPDEAPENAAFVEIDDGPPGELRQRVFSGWMFSSSPGLSALDHAVFDVWLVQCLASRPVPEETVAAPPPRKPLPEAGIIPPHLPAQRQR